MSTKTMYIYNISYLPTRERMTVNKGAAGNAIVTFKSNIWSKFTWVNQKINNLVWLKLNQTSLLDAKTETCMDWIISFTSLSFTIHPNLGLCHLQNYRFVLGKLYVSNTRICEDHGHDESLQAESWHLSSI